MAEEPSLLAGSSIYINYIKVIINRISTKLFICTKTIETGPLKHTITGSGNILNCENYLYSISNHQKDSKCLSYVMNLELLS